MDLEMNECEYKRTGSRRSDASGSNSVRRRSSRFSFSLTTQADHDDDNDSVSEAGDIGDRVLSRRHSDIGRSQFSFDGQAENVAVVPVSETISPLSTDAIIHTEDKTKGSEKDASLLVEYFSSLVFLGFFGILGVLMRYGLQKLFGPGNLRATSNKFYMYLDLPSNMVGSFLMGCFWVFKKEITNFSDKLAIGLSTGFLGSLTTFSGWNQSMIELSVEGDWDFAVLGFVIGLSLVHYSFMVGVKTSEGVKWLHKRLSVHSQSSSKGESGRYHLVLLLVVVVLLGCLWCMSAILEKDEFKHGGSEAQLWLGCIVGPIGVWSRWFLARLNGRGLGKSGHLRWVPFGTLIANVSAACVMAALATLKKEVNTTTCDTIATGIQLGLLGCLSTVSTFIAEIHAMWESENPWRAFVYALGTILVSFSLGTLIYSVPVWTN